ncbi:hypothetical protein I5535_04360 [Rhodobacteraceae bacterium F11138]|nr:hypothetical protein [Rhodobacteraceae bacterium F11138]
MPQTTKIATCCYCGTRAALVLRGQIRHELACSACGAPLHELKMLRQDPAGAAHAVPGRSKSRKQARISRRPVKKSKPRKKRRGLMYKMLEEAWDVVEDLLD